MAMVIDALLHIKQSEDRKSSKHRSNWNFAVDVSSVKVKCEISRGRQIGQNGGSTMIRLDLQFPSSTTSRSAEL